MSPEERVGKYLVGFAYHFSFRPRDIDEFSIHEFDSFAYAVDQIGKESRKGR